MDYLDKMFSLKGKISVVTGAARGNGRAISEALAKAGSKVILIDVLEEELSDTIKDFRLDSLDVVGYPCDLTSKNEFNKLVSYLDNFEKVDVLVNNAGITFGAPILDYPLDAWNKTLDINLKVPFLLSQQVGKLMVKNKTKGSIINITSLNAELAFPDNPAYIASKGALKQLSKSFALGLGKHEIRVNSVGPGYFKTDMTKKSWNNLQRRELIKDNTVLNRWGTPSDIQGLIIFLASESSSYITGQDFYIDGGWLIKGL
jgi:NAD(P)-dependent dehydrogenase (short-subunit alcohol dehydrogenase family)